MNEFPPPFSLIINSGAAAVWTVHRQAKLWEKPSLCSQNTKRPPQIEGLREIRVLCYLLPHPPALGSFWDWFQPGSCAMASLTQRGSNIPRKIYLSDQRKQEKGPLWSKVCAWGNPCFFRFVFFLFLYFSLISLPPKQLHFCNREVAWEAKLPRETMFN